MGRCLFGRRPLACSRCDAAIAARRQPPPAIVFFNVAYTKVVALNAQWPSPSSNSGFDSDSDYEYDSDGPARVRRRWRWLAKCGLSSCCVRVGRTQQRPASKTPTWHLVTGNCIQIEFELKIKTKTSTNEKRKITHIGIVHVQWLFKMLYEYITNVCGTECN